MRRRPRLNEEEGIALTVAILAIALMVTLAGVALNQAVGALRTSTHQKDVKRALQAADSAIEAATYGISRLDVGSSFDIDPRNPSLGVTQSCLVTTGEIGGIDTVPLNPLTQADPNGDQWCPENAGGFTEDGVEFSYRMSQLLRAGAGPCGSGSAIDLDRDVVGVGRSGTVVRRVKAHLTASLALLSGAAVQSSSTTSPLRIEGLSSVLGDAASNGPIVGSGANVVSGNVTPGPGQTATGVVAAGSNEAACKEFTIPDVQQGTVVTANNNVQRSDGCINTTLGILFAATLCVGGPKVTYDPGTRSLDVFSNGRAILTGTNYSFCSIKVRGNGVLQISKDSPVTRIFLDDPNNCRNSSGGLISGAGTITVSESGRIINCHPDTQPESLQIYAVGNDDPSLATTQTFSATSLPSLSQRIVACLGTVPAVTGEPMTVVAPHSKVQIGGSTRISGQVAAKVVEMSGTAAVNPVNALVNLDRLGANPILPLYHATDYVECTGEDFDQLPAASPAQGC